MTATELSVLGAREEKPKAAAGGALAVPVLWLSGIAAFVVPAVSGTWRRATLFAAALVAGVNTLFALGWLFAIMLCYGMWGQLSTGRHATEGLRPMAPAARELIKYLHEGWKQSGPLDKTSMIVGTLGLVATAYLVPFFVLLPFGSRPGPNKACVRHVARTVLLGSSLVHWWGMAFCAVVLATDRTLHNVADDEHWGLLWLLTAFCVLLVWHLAVLIYAARREFRSDKEMPQPHDPWCDDCGYNLIMATDAGRCPECGRAVAESLGAHTRPETAWEKWPSIWNWRIIAAQVNAVVRHPRKLFFSMSTLTGQAAAQKWHLISMVIVGLVGAMIVPAFYVSLDAEWRWLVIPSAGAMGLAWAIFGMMMVGIETMGIATFSRIRKQPPGGVYLGAAAKVTCYASFLMLLWVILGGVQLVALVYYAQPDHPMTKGVSSGAARRADGGGGVVCDCAHWGASLVRADGVSRGADDSVCQQVKHVASPSRPMHASARCRCHLLDLVTDEREVLAVGRPGGDIDGALAAEELGHGGHFFGLHVHELQHHVLAFGVVVGADDVFEADEHHELAIRGDVREPVVAAVVGGDLFLLAAIRLHAEDLHLAGAVGIEINVLAIGGEFRAVLAARGEW